MSIDIAKFAQMGNLLKNNPILNVRILKLQHEREHIHHYGFLRTSEILFFAFGYNDWSFII